MQATALTFVIVATKVGLTWHISAATGAALLTAGLLSAILFPAAAMRLLARASQCAHLPRTNYAHPPGTNQLAAPVSQRAVPAADRARPTDGPVPFGAPPTGSTQEPGPG